MNIRRYDKSAHSGRGDRADPATWPQARGPLQVVLFEGWMLGFAPVADEAAAAVDPHLLPVNAFLRGYRDAWDSHVDAWLVVRVAQPDYAYRWRLQVGPGIHAGQREGSGSQEPGPSLLATGSRADVLGG
jgi:D-glycerate 3-kinase